MTFDRVTEADIKGSAAVAPQATAVSDEKQRPQVPDAPNGDDVGQKAVNEGASEQQNPHPSTKEDLSKTAESGQA